MRSLLLVGVLCGAPPSAAAQSPHAALHHGAGAAPSFEDRVRLADAAAVATVDAVEPGRIRMRDAQRVLGAVPERFEIKRAPSSAPQLEPGQRILVLLRGGRPPFVLVDPAPDIVHVPDPDDAARWSAAVQAVRDAGLDAERLRPLYLDWVRSEDAGLREIALRALLDLRAPLHPIPDDAAVQCARLALDARESVPQREACAAVATLRAAGTDILLAALRQGEPSLTPDIADLALRGGVTQRRPAARDALLRALHDPDTSVRRSALRAAPLLALDELRPELERMAAEDPAPELRQRAARLLSASAKGEAAAPPAGR